MDNFAYTKQRLVDGVSQRQIAKELGVDHSTIGYWIKNDFKSVRKNIKQDIGNIVDFCKINSKEYSYALGCYLGDGYINHTRGTQKLRIANNSNQIEIIHAQEIAIGKLFPNNKILAYRQPRTNCTYVMVHNKYLSEFFPQHGKGEKYTRKLELLDWQLEIVNSTPHQFLCGLIDSDGCEYIQSYTKKGKTYSYTHYCFTNKSIDIINMFKYVANILNIEYNENLDKNQVTRLFIQKAESVSRIEEAYRLSYLHKNH